MSKKWTGQDIFLLGAAVCTLCLMYLTIIFPTSTFDTQMVDGIDEQNQEQQYVDFDKVEQSEMDVRTNQSFEEYAYKYQNGVEDHGDSK